MNIMWRNEIVATQQKGSKVLPFVVAVEGIEQYKLPFGLFGFNRREASWIEFCNWAESRCFPEDRVGVKEELAKLGMKDYIPLQIVEKTKGRLATDDFWVDFSK